MWSKTPAPDIAKKYWKLADNAMIKDVLLAVRADEATHRQFVKKKFCFIFLFNRMFAFNLESIIN